MSSPLAAIMSLGLNINTDSVHFRVASSLFLIFQLSVRFAIQLILSQLGLKRTSSKDVLDVFDLLKRTGVKESFVHDLYYYKSGECVSTDTFSASRGF